MNLPACNVMPMLADPDTEIVDVGSIFGHSNPAGSTDYVSIFHEEFSNMFGPMGEFIINKQVEELTKNGEITPERLPSVIRHLSNSVESVMGKDSARDLQRTLKRRCGLPV